MAVEIKKVDNPLTLIGVFALVSESIALAALPFLANSAGGLPPPFMWFAILFPTGLVLLFFFTLWINRAVLYAPGDFADQAHFMSILKGKFSKTAAAQTLKEFWKPKGELNEANAKSIREWMAANGLVASISAFLYSNDAAYEKAREKAVTDLNLT